MSDELKEIKRLLALNLKLNTITLTALSSFPNFSIAKTQVIELLREVNETLSHLEKKDGESRHSSREDGN